jgi:hypothetical protein
MSLAQYRSQIVTRATVALMVLMAGSIVVLPANACLPAVLGLCAGGLTSIGLFWVRAKDAMRTKDLRPRQGTAFLLRGYFLGYAAMVAVLILCALLPHLSLGAAGAGLLLVNVVIIASAIHDRPTRSGPYRQGWQAETEERV